MTRRALSLVVLTLVLQGCDDVSGREPTSTERSAVPVSIAVVTPVEKRVRIRKTAPLRSRTDTTLVAESAGIIVTLPVLAGKPVEAGEVIAQLADATERAQLKAARARLSGLVAAEVPLSQKESAEAAVEQAQEQLRRRTVRAPASGIIDSYMAEVGDYVAPGSPIGRLVDPERLWCVATVLETEILRIDSDASVGLSVPAWPGARFTGKVLRQGTAALQRSGQFEVEVEIAPDSRLRPGFVATVELPVEDLQRITAAPRDATFIRHGTIRIFAVVDKGERLVAEERTITTRRVPGRPDLADILTGVEPGERIVVRGRLGLVSGNTVKIVEH